MGGILQIVLVALAVCGAVGASAWKPLDVYKNTLINSLRVVSGYNASRHQFGYQVSLQKDGQHHCGGTLIGYLYVLTAAHCVKYQDKESYEVVLGMLNQGESHEDVQRIKVYHVVVHPWHNGKVGPYDIAVLELDAPAKLNHAVQMATLPRPERCGNLRSALVSGWGRTSPMADETPVGLRWSSQTVINLEKCKENLETLVDSSEPLDDTMLCTVGEQQDFQSICNGDSGGPLVVQSRGIPIVVGVVSWTLRPCGINALAPSVYTNVCSHLDFLRKYMG